MSYYKGVCREAGKEVDKKYAFGYALERILENDGEREEFVEWYYSGIWIECEDGHIGYECPASGEE